MNIVSADFAVHIGTGDSRFFETPRRNAIGAGVAAVAIGDLTNSGVAEIVTANAASGSLTVLSRLDQESFISREDLTDGIVDPLDVQIVAVNGDEFADVIVADRFLDSMLILAGNGAASFDAPVMLPACDAPTRLDFGDVNGDGSDDIVVACFASDDIAVLLSDNAGGFTAATTFAGVGEPQDLLLRDIDGDTNLDVVLADSTDNNPAIRIAFGAGDGTFSAPVLAAPGAVIAALDVGDINNDGALDLAIADLGQGVRIALGLGNGSFGAPFAAPGSNIPVAVGLVDFDGDGFDDVVSLQAGGGERSRATSVAISNGNGSFGRERRFATATGSNAGFAEPGIPRTLNVADVDNDGRQDVVVGAAAAEFDGSLSVNFNRAEGIAQVDTDGDGVVDAIDNCPNLMNADQRDTNGDGFGNRCDPDLNNDNIVNVIDLGILRSFFFNEPG